MEQPEDVMRSLLSHEPGVMGEHDSVTTAVVVPMIKRPKTSGKQIEDWALLYQRRSEDLENQPGEICFPGGIKESDDQSPKDTAIRETSEELQIPSRSIEIITRLDAMIMPWQLVLYPYVATLNVEPPLSPDSREVDSVFTVPLEEVLRVEPEEHHLKLIPEPSDGFPFDKIPGGRDYDWSEGRLPELFYEFEDDIVWGITARVTKNFSDVVKGLNQENQ